MGIPSYFSHIIRSYKHIVSKWNKAHQTSNLYLDSNSIIYDICKKMRLQDYKSTVEFEADLIANVCMKIDEYIDMIHPTNGVYIAFDGVPPFAKMVQQKERRYKGWLEKNVTKKSDDVATWDTVNITPGTPFMLKLDKEVEQYFKGRSAHYVFFEVSTSSECGEGEQKIFNYIRSHPEQHKHHITTVYALDADIIILGLNHLKYGKMYMMRESTYFHFEETNDYYLLNLSELAQSIMKIMGTKNANKINDYVLLSLFLGNDFMPKFPSINIRTNGFQTLLAIYKQSIKPEEIVFDGKNMNWRLLKKMVHGMALDEHERIKEVYSSRAKYKLLSTDRSERLLNLPKTHREVELYINPNDSQWEERYYSALFSSQRTPQLIRSVCQNYLSMLLWNMTYYTTGCVNWRMHYEYTYPPLLCDLEHNVKHVTFPEYNTVLKSHQLLAYVLPEEHLKLLPAKVQACVKSKNWHKNNDIQWAFCNYFWESHVTSPVVDYEELTKL